jgi:hypothetical protein
LAGEAVEFGDQVLAGDAAFDEAADTTDGRPWCGRGAVALSALAGTFTA